MRRARFSFVNQNEPAAEQARRHLLARLAVETDPADVRLAAPGFRVKEMIGGLGYWRHEGHDVEGTGGAAAPLNG